MSPGWQQTKLLSPVIAPGAADLMLHSLLGQPGEGRDHSRTKAALILHGGPAGLGERLRGGSEEGKLAPSSWVLPKVGLGAGLAHGEHEG